jgi:hypothetical protein
MRGIQIVETTGPETALALVELPEPEPSHMMTPGSGRFPLERASEALGVIDRREAMGKVVLDVGHR